MHRFALSGILLVFMLFLLLAGCTQPPVREPTVTVTDIGLSDVTLRTMTVNTTVNVYNPNPVGARVSRVAFDIYYLDDTGHYLGHGEQTNIDVKESGNTTVTIPVTIGNVQALQAMGTLVRKGTIIVKVNGSAFIDLKAFSWEFPFERTRKFPASEFSVLIPEVSSGGTTINVTEGLEQARGLLDALSG
jgi:LEA14-like dessication related protein